MFDTFPDEAVPAAYGFDKQATQADPDDGMIKRGVIEDPDNTGTAIDGFAV